MTDRPRVAIIGAGHNGLVCSCYLAEAGFDVSVFERRSIVGGLCVTEELLPGIKTSSVAGFFGMLRKEIIDDLELEKRGLEPYFTNPTEIILLPGERYLYTPRLDGEARIEIGEVSQSDLDGWARFWSEISRASRAIYPYHLRFGVTQHEIEQMLVAQGLSTIARYIFQGTLMQLLPHYFSHPSLLAAAATCVVGFPDQKGSVYSCIHLGTANTLGEMGAWGLVKGGMGAVTQALLSCAQERGVRICTNVGVRSVALDGTVAVGVNFDDGRFEAFDVVVSNADPVSTFTRLLPSERLPASIKAKLQNLHPTASAGKIHFALNGLPEFPVLAGLANYHECTICLAIPIDSVIAASSSAAAGIMPDELMITILFNSVSDPTLSSTGQHLLSLAYHWLPSVFDGEPWDQNNRQILLEKTIVILEQHCPNIREYIEASVVITPGDLKREYGLESMDCWHLPMTTEFLMERRRFGDKEYSTPFENMFLCGAGTYPGGNVTGAPGRNCAKQIVEERVSSQKAVIVGSEGA